MYNIMFISYAVSLSTMLVPGTEDKLSGLVASPLTHRDISLALYWND